MSELKPCPFCGGNARLTVWTPNASSVSCICCGAHVNTNTEAEAIEAWNTRHERTCTVANLGGRPDSLPILLCERCGAFTYSKADGSTWNFCPDCGAKVVGE